MEQEFISNFWQGLLAVFAAVNWFFVAIFIIVTWLLNAYSESSEKAGKLGWFGKINKGWRVFALGVIMAGLYAYFNRYADRESFAQLFYSVIVAMVGWKLVAEKGADWLEIKLLKTKKPEFTE